MIIVLGLVLPALAQSAQRVEGTVVTPEGQPVADAIVSIAALGLATNTGDDGSFVLEGVPVGSWEISFGPADGPALREQIQVTTEETRKTLRLTVPRLPRGVSTTLTVQARADGLVGRVDTASEGIVGQIDLQTRPLLRSGDLVETIPGVIATQHSAGGKANQYFLRGFNLDHGTDFGVRVDSVPVNMPSHGHGQGYLDLNFLIPELVQRLTFSKGFAAARNGDFTAAGAADFALRDRMEKNIIGFTGGEYGYARGLALGSGSLGGGDLLAGVELVHDDGPWEVPGNFRKLNLAVRFSRGGPVRGFRVTALGYDATWDSTDHIPRRAVEAGEISRFGTVDDTTGGASSRYSVTGEWWRAGPDSLIRLNGYLVGYDLDLYSNFTYALENPDRGDQFEQRDDRWIVGAEARYENDGRWGSFDVMNLAGFQLRRDRIDNGLFRTVARDRLSTVRADSISLLAASPHASSTIYWTPWLRSTFGVRGDFYSATVDSDDNRNSGSATKALASPKLSVALGPWASTELYGSFGGGFHTITVDPTTGLPADPVPLLVRGWGWELGVRTESLPGLNSSLSVFALDLDSELVFVGDAGGTEASRPSRRRGVELANFYSFRPWLRFDLDLALTHARFDDGDPANRIPGAVESVIAGGVAVDGWKRWSGALRVGHFGEFPLTEDDRVRAEASTLVNGRIAYRFPLGIEVGVEVFNLLDAEASDIQYYYASRLPGEPAAGLEDVHFHPVEPRTFRVLASWRR